MSEPAAAPARPVVNWHAMEAAEVLSKADVNADKGLTADEAKRRLIANGANVLPEGKQKTLLERIWAQLSNVLEMILFVSAIIMLGFQEWTNAIFILLVIGINVVVGLLQEGKAEKAASAISNMLAPTATVTRGGETEEIDASELVVGDIVHLKAGDKVPADLRVLNSAELKCQEALLTGEAEAVKKTVPPVEIDCPLAERHSIIFSGTLCVYGQGKGVVVETGVNAEIGKISALMSNVKSAATPLILQLEQFSRWVSVVTIFLSIITLLVAHLARDEDLDDSFVTAIGVAVALIPEGLPAVVTITLAIGVTHMARQKAIVKSLPAVETLGCVSVICSDKTGTLTKNEMTVVNFCTSNEKFKVTGTGYKPEGRITDMNGTDLGDEQSARMLKLLMAAGVCNDASVRTNDEGNWTVVGGPTEGALVALHMKLSGDSSISAIRSKYPRIFAIPFQSDYKFMATMHDIVPDGESKSKRVVFVKGAPDRLIARCRAQAKNRSLWEEEPLTTDYWTYAVQQYSELGLRVLALCHYVVDDSVTSVAVSDILEGEKKLQIDALVAIIDPPRPEAIDAVEACHSAQIVVKMITGDSPITATSIGNQLGIQTPYALTGNDLDKMSDDELRTKCMEANIYARVTPEHKLRVLQAIQWHGHVACMTGDGVNDAPALKQAAVGVAMGVTGTNVAMEASKMILADDNFASMEKAVREGRGVYDNLLKILAFVLPTNFAQGLSISVAIFIGLDAPLTALQVLFVNLVTSVTFGLVIALELPEDDIMTRRPRKLGQPILSKFLIFRTIFVGTLTIVFIILNSEWEKTMHDTSSQDDEDSELAKSRAVAMITLILCQSTYVFNCRFLRKSSVHFHTLYGNKWIAAAGILNLAMLAMLVYIPVINDTFGMEPVGGIEWLRSLMFAVVLFIIVEISKVFQPYITRCLRPLLRLIQLSCFCFTCCIKEEPEEDPEEFYSASVVRRSLLLDYESDDEDLDDFQDNISLRSRYSVTSHEPAPQTKVLTTIITEV